MLIIISTVLLLLVLAGSHALAGSDTWKQFPSTGDWNTAMNWSSDIVPNGPNDTATFVTSIVHGISISNSTEVDGIVFNSGFGATVYTITASPQTVLKISGTGITNNSGTTQHFLTAFDGTRGVITFAGSATAGTSTNFINSGNTLFTENSKAGAATFTNSGGDAANATSGGSTQFSDFSTASDGTFINNGASVSAARPGVTAFYQDATAANGTFINDAGTTDGAHGGVTGFQGGDAGTGNFTNNGAAVMGPAEAGSFTLFYWGSARNGTFTSNGGTVSGAPGGGTVFRETSKADAATLIANGGTNGGEGGAVYFEESSTGGTSRIKLFGNGKLDISGQGPPGVTVGSVEGTGNVFLGANNLAVGSSNRNTTFSGRIEDGGFNGGTGGSLTKIGKGKLTLSNANTYTGGTTVTQGTLLVKNTTGSATGIGAVQVNGGTLQGIGKVDGAVTVGTGVGTTSRANLLAGNSATSPGTLTINNPVTFQSDSTYKCVLNRGSGTASKLTAFGVNIDSGAKFALLDTGSGTLPTGKVFTVINNISTLPFGGAGAFSNHANGSTFTSNGTNFKVNYKGGTNNDMTLTVVP